jgi:hypothetical protein
VFVINPRESLMVYVWGKGMGVRALRDLAQQARCRFLLYPICLGRGGRRIRTWAEGVSSLGFGGCYESIASGEFQSMGSMK